MKKYAFNEITTMQYIFFINGAQVGVGVLSLPSDLAKTAGTDGWISVILGWLLSMAISLIIIQVMKSYPEGTLIDLLSFHFGKWAGKAGALLSAAYFGLGAITVAYSTFGILKSWILPETPVYMLMLLFMLPGYLLASHGLRILARYTELMFFLMLPLLFFFLFPLKDSHWVYLSPTLKEGWKNIFLAVKTTFFSFVGFETAVMLYPFLTKKQYASVGIVVANTISLLFYLVPTLVCFVLFSPDEITSAAWPTLTMFRVVEFSYLERFDIVYLTIYLFVISTTVIPYMFFSVFSLSQLFGKQDHRPFLGVSVLAVLFVSVFFVPSYLQIKRMGEFWNKAAMAYAIVLPLCLWIYVQFRAWIGGRRTS
ncbi:endospore germination permease [Paenibacillus filicis]|uniref:Endospore germination permease n=1 Tax=Paenibacillus gyeongsangnamensis TaxID=3388067 RepID=A0ABT4Q7B5_9BACL|nr:endospore germination permease [Paenibacillus filicis]MCZ8512713.1 endospore germination permease [Paenibacillus filicis]